MFFRTVKNLYNSDAGKFRMHKPILLLLVKVCRSQNFQSHLPQLSKYHYILALQNTDLSAIQRGLESRMQWRYRIVMAEHLNVRYTCLYSRFSRLRWFDSLICLWHLPHYVLNLNNLCRLFSLLLCVCVFQLWIKWHPALYNNLQCAEKYIQCTFFFFKWGWPYSHLSQVLK